MKKRLECQMLPMVRLSLHRPAAAHAAAPGRNRTACGTLDPLTGSKDLNGRRAECVNFGLAHFK